MINPSFDFPHVSFLQIKEPTEPTMGNGKYYGRKCIDFK